MADPFFIQHWETQRRLGKGRFIVAHGIFGWGLTTMLLALVWDGWMELRNPSMDTVLQNFIKSSLWGTLYGWVLWNACETKYHKEIHNNCFNS
jgi:hypothetical protein